MSTERESTARALAVSTSPPDSPKVGREPFHPPWPRPRTSSSRSREASTYVGEVRRFAKTTLVTARQVFLQLLKTYMMMAWWQRIVAAVALVTMATLGILFLVFSEQVFHWLLPIAEKWRDLPAGWLIVWAMTFVCAFPPLIGFSSAVTVAGFVYGIPVGWLLVATATVTGSLCSFVVSRTLLSGYVERLIAHDKRFAAFALTLKHDGLKLLIMIRFCPLPYSLSNGAMSTVPTIHPLMFALATAASTPKLLIHVFIGRQLARIAESGGKMDTSTRLVNYASIAASGILGLTVGWVIYAKTVARARQLEAEERARPPDPLAHDQSPSLFSDEPDYGATATMLRDDDIGLFETEVEGADYRDNFTDEDDIFSGGEGDEEQELGMQRLSPGKYPR
ncbi:MAG: Tlg2-vesicle protein [Thelocarpon superellum]|nr:MAG: Tlg2-vesicle protein [Thelocarpon superellum]